MSQPEPTWTEAVGGLLQGGATLFGKRVELAWPDGPPFDEATLRSIGDGWAPVTGPDLVGADAGFCLVPVPCGRSLMDGACDRHGRCDGTCTGDPRYQPFYDDHMQCLVCGRLYLPATLRR